MKMNIGTDLPEGYTVSHEDLAESAGTLIAHALLPLFAENMTEEAAKAIDDAMAEIAARREAAAPMVGDAAVVAADPVAAMEAVDDRMTGPVDGLGAALDAAAAAVSIRTRGRCSSCRHRAQR